MNEAPIADVYADMRCLLAFLVEKQQIAFAQIAHGNQYRYLPLGLRIPWHCDSSAAVTIFHQAAAIKASRGIPGVSIGLAEHFFRVNSRIGCNLVVCPQARVLWDFR